MVIITLFGRVIQATEMESLWKERKDRIHLFGA